MSDLRRVDVFGIKHSPADNILIIDSDQSQGRVHAAEHFRGLGANVDYENIPTPKLQGDDPNAPLVPNAILQRIVSWMAEV